MLKTTATGTTASGVSVEKKSQTQTQVQKKNNNNNRNNNRNRDRDRNRNIERMRTNTRLNNNCIDDKNVSNLSNGIDFSNLKSLVKSQQLPTLPNIDASTTQLQSQSQSQTLNNNSFNTTINTNNKTNCNSNSNKDSNSSNSNSNGTRSNSRKRGFDRMGLDPNKVDNDSIISALTLMYTFGQEGAVSLLKSLADGTRIFSSDPTSKNDNNNNDNNNNGKNDSMPTTIAELFGFPNENSNANIKDSVEPPKKKQKLSVMYFSCFFDLKEYIYSLYLSLLFVIFLLGVPSLFLHCFSFLFFFLPFFVFCFSSV